jgi:hypothetical protein
MHQSVEPFPFLTHVTASPNCLIERMLTEIGPLDVSFRWYVNVSGTPAAR